MIARMLCNVIVGAALVLTTNAMAADSSPFEQIAHADPFTGFKFPRMIGAYAFQGTAPYERVHLGYGVHYIEVAGAKASISIYDMNLSDIKDGTSDLRVIEEFDKMSSGITAMVEQGVYRSARRIDGPQLSKAWLQVDHEIELANGVRIQSYSFIRGQSGRFVKIRVSTPSKGSYARLPIFLLGVSRSIGLLGPASASAG